MSDRNVSTDALRTAARALTEYMNAVNDDLEKMHDAVIDCSDNMAHDVYSPKAIIKVEECIVSLSKVLIQAEELRGKILSKIRRIEESGESF